MIQARLVLPAVVDAAVAPELKRDLLLHYYCGRDLTLEASRVESIGLAELVLLWSAADSFESAGLDLYIEAPSQAFLTAFRNVGAAA